MFSCSFATLNVRGLKEMLKRKAVFLFLKGQNKNCILLQETHSSNLDVNFWTNQWGDRILFSHGTNRSAGVAVLFNKFQGDIITYEVDGDGHWIIAVLKVGNDFIIMINVYGHKTNSQNENMFEIITQTVSEFKLVYPTDYIAMGGDWNAAPDEWEDRCPSKFQTFHYNQLITDFSSKNALIDIWRIQNPGKKQFTWHKPNGTSKSRLDYWLVTEPVANISSKVLISKAPLTDHCSVELKLSSTNSIKRNKSYWKFNSSLLKIEDYCKRIKEIIIEIQNSESFSNYSNKWEFLKYKIRMFSMEFSKTYIKIKRQEENELFSELNQYCNKQNHNELDKEILMSLQTKLDNLYLKKAEGAFVRSRAKWIEEGEKNTTYFSNLEKRRQINKAVTSLLIDGVECKDIYKIEKEVYRFYSSLYTSNYSIIDSNAFIMDIKDYIPKIDNVFKEKCESSLRMEEIDAVVMKLASNKSPGSDGLTADFYKFFWKDIRLILFYTLQECIEKKELLPSMKQGLITLIPKHSKDKRILDNLRPITLLNTDYKLLSGCVAARLKTSISQIISETQSGFLSGRVIHNNIRLVLDLIDYSDMFTENGFLLFLDFYKAFDSVEHPFILETLTHFGFGKEFINLIDMMYKDINSCVALEHGTCRRFPVRRGIRQGCNTSPLLFIMVAELLAISLKNKGVKGINILDKNILISQFADDTTIILKHESEIPTVLEVINKFSEASGVMLNTDKCEIMALHDHPAQAICNIKVKTEVKYLGITITKKRETREKENIGKNIEKFKSILNSWLQRDTTIFGRVLLTKMESLSRAVFPASSLEISDRMIQQINRVNFNFIWKNKCHNIRKADTVKSIEDGGLNAIDFAVMNGALKLKWLNSFIRCKDSFWFCIPRAVFSKMGGIDFLLQCDYDICKLPTKLSDFHQQVLLYWKLLFCHNFTPHNTPLWNNRYILCNKKSFFLKTWMEKGVWSITQLIDDTGEFLNYADLCNKFSFNFPIKDYNKVKRSVPIPVKIMIQQTRVHSDKAAEPRSLCINGVQLNSLQFSNKFIRNSLTTHYYPFQLKRKFILKDYDAETSRKIRKRYLSYPLLPKAKEVYFKILNEIYPSNNFLHKKFNLDDNSCGFCKEETETTEHLFYYCKHVYEFWTAFQSLLYSKNIKVHPLNMCLIKTGVMLKEKNLEFLVNNLILLAIHYIHKCKYAKTKPHINGWKNELKNFIKTLKYMKIRNAQRLFSLMDLFMLLN